MATSAFGVDHGLVSKSYVGGGVFKPASALRAAGKKRVPGSYARSKGPTKADTKFKAEATKLTQQLRHNEKVMTEPGRRPRFDDPDFKQVKVRGQRKPVNVYGESSFLSRTLPSGVGGLTLRTGSKSSGQSHVIYDKTKSGAKKTLKHEMAHAQPKRSIYRMQQIADSPKKTMREEARADAVLGHYRKVKPNSAYQQVAQARNTQRKVRKTPIIGGLRAKPQKMQLKAGLKNMSAAGGPRYKVKPKDVDAYRKVQNDIARNQKRNKRRSRS